jgi:hypothetical protein
MILVYEATRFWFLIHYHVFVGTFTVPRFPLGSCYLFLTRISCSLLSFEWMLPSNFATLVEPAVFCICTFKRLYHCGATMRCLWFSRHCTATNLGIRVA